MTTKARKIAIKARIAAISRVVACAAFLVLTIIGVSSLVRAMSLEDIANENGIPSVWAVGSLGNPETITVPITYWDQKADSCEDSNRQFEWVDCGYWTKGVLQHIVNPTLGADRLPTPAFVTATDAWAANHDVFTMNVTGHTPVEPTDNFYRWFHEVPGLSKEIDSTVTFTRVSPKVYTYGGHNIFPVDNSTTLGDKKWTGQDGKQHNFHFTAHLGFSAKIEANGEELFEFSGDDDVWVFLNNQLVLDIGGLHEAIYGWFRINADGTLTTYVEKVNDTSKRTEEITSCMKNAYGDYNTCTNPFNQEITGNSNAEAISGMGHLKDITIQTLDIGLHKEDVVNLDFFYAERSTTESNTQITISNMNWPISADSVVTGEIIGQVQDSNSNIIHYETSVTNRDPSYPLDVLRIAAFIREQAKGHDDQDGFLALSSATLEYSLTPEDESSWQPVEITAPLGSLSGFTLASPIHLSPYGQAGDTAYFRFNAETADAVYGKVDCQMSYFTELSGVSGVTYDQTTLDYGDPNNTDPVDPTPEQPDPNEPTEPDPVYTVTVEYVYSDGSTASETRTLTDLADGDDYTIFSPDIPGFTPDQSFITGVIDRADAHYRVTYYPNSDEKTRFTVTIDYVYEDGDEAYPTYEGSYAPGEGFSVDSPEIPGFTPNRTVVSGTVENGDLHYTVVYRKNKTPETPGTPSTPTTPTEPSAPSPSEPTTPDTPKDDNLGTLIPDGSLGDAMLGYLDPLGAVSYVPNTGVISSAVATLFDQGFAEVILSQGFVMGVLLIFAGAFAVYFSLRDASKANLANKQRLATRTANGRNVRKSPAASKKATKNAKTAAKAARKTTPKSSKKSR